MSLSTRLLLGYGYLAALVPLAAGTATVGFFDIGRHIERVVERNTDTVRATTELLEELERQDSATLAALIERPGRARLEDANAEFRQLLDDFEQRTAGKDEQANLERIRREYRAYHRARSELLGGQSDSPLRAYERRVFPKFKIVKQSVVTLLNRQHDQMISAGAEVRADASRYGAWLGALVLVALLSLVLLARGLRADVIDRLSSIRDVASAVASGEHRRRIHTRREDELGLIASQFNEALDRIQELERRAAGRMGGLERRLDGLLYEGWGAAAMYDASGQLVTTTFDPGAEELESLRQHDDTVRRAGRALLDQPDGEGASTDGERTVELADGRVASLERLVLRSGAPLGWVATVENASTPA
ncbi:MAG: HAMP domain-containing protein [Bradymonadaceae bacterium]